MVLLTPHITLIVHPINTEAHPTVPPGWRWAVMVGLGDLADMSRCPNAGWCPTQQAASLEGEMVAAAVVKAVRMLGIDAGYAQTVLDHDPIPPEGDVVTIGV